jgi:hypothetical protein
LIVSDTSELANALHYNMKYYGIILLFCQATSIIARPDSMPFFHQSGKIAKEIIGLLQIARGGSTMTDDSKKSVSNPLFCLAPNSTQVEKEKLYIQKRNGSLELLDQEKVRGKKQTLHVG